jgi:hypothetical protein
MFARGVPGSAWVVPAVSALPDWGVPAVAALVVPAWRVPGTSRGPAAWVVPALVVLAPAWGVPAVADWGVPAWAVVPARGVSASARVASARVVPASARVASAQGVFVVVVA